MNGGGGGVFGKVKDVAIGAGVVLGGMAVGRTVSNLIPIGTAGDPVVDAIKGVGIGLGIRIFGEKMIGRDYARLAAIGAVVNPLKALITHYAPGAATFLGAGPLPFPRYPNAVRALQAPISSYPGSNGMASYPSTYNAGYLQ